PFRSPLSLSSNLVIQTLSNGRMKAFTADKGEQLLDMTLPLNAGVGPPMTYMLDGKQFIALMAGTGVTGRGGGGGGGGRGPPPPPAPTDTNNNPKLLVYAVPN